MRNKFVVALMIVAIIGLTALSVYQQTVIDHQRNLLLLMWRFIQAGCPGGPLVN